MNESDRRSRTRLTALIGAAAVAVVLIVLIVLSGGGGSDDDPAQSGRAASGPLKRLNLTLDFYPNADHAGIYAAQASGRFREQGLDVRVRAPADPAAPLKLVAAGKTDLAVSYEPEVLRARDKGAPVVAIGALVQKPLTSIVSLPKAGIRSPADLRGKRVGTAGIDYQSAYLQAVLDRAGVDRSTVRERNVGFDLLPALATGKVDAVLGAFWNYEGVDLRLRGRDPQIIRIDQAGVPAYNELVIVASEKSVRERRDELRRFIAALGDGTHELADDPAAGLSALLRANRDLDKRLQRESIKVTTPLLLPPEGRPYGWQDPGEWAAFGQFMRRNKLIKHPAEGAFTNELLPAAGG
jgi:putative hydroxymethylpyrimidine transport system substrate-binding protein